MLEVLELVVARAGRREEHDLARLGRRGRPAHGGRQVAALLVGNVERGRELVGRRSDQIRAAPFALRSAASSA